MTAAFEFDLRIPPIEGTVETFYDDDGRSFWTAHELDPVRSVLVNDLEIHTDADHRVLFVDGYSPAQRWVDADLRLPSADPGSIRVSYQRDIPIGASVRLTAPSEWYVYFDVRRSWLRVSAPGALHDGRAVRIHPGLIMVIQGDRLAELWIRVRRQRPGLN